MLTLYRFIVGLLFYLGLPIILPLVLISGRHRRGLKERLGFYEPAPAEWATTTDKRCWIHAASIGEVRAAAVLIDELRGQLPGWEFLLTAMTIHGRDFAGQQFGAEVSCRLAPLDVPYSVNRAVRAFRPDLYVCLETELWPVLIDTLKRKEVPAALINGRMSARSVAGYRRFKFLFSPLLNSFQSIGVIGDTDRRRFIEAGADAARVTITGNIKDDTRLPDDCESTGARWRELLHLSAETDVFIAGSTHHPEEELLLPLLDEFISRGGVALIAPRHLDRLAEIESLIGNRAMEYDLLSELKNGSRRSRSLILVDTFGDLGGLYSIAAFVFVGGSLSNSGGHNVMEPAIWERAVLFGPDTADFKEAAAALEESGGGFRVAGIDELGEKISQLQQDRNLLAHAGTMAGRTARQQQGAAGRQAALIIGCLPHTDPPQPH